LAHITLKVTNVLALLGYLCPGSCQLRVRIVSNDFSDYFSRIISGAIGNRNNYHPVVGVILLKEILYPSLNIVFFIVRRYDNR